MNSNETLLRILKDTDDVQVGRPEIGSIPESVHYYAIHRQFYILIERFEAVVLTRDKTYQAVEIDPNTPIEDIYHERDHFIGIVATGYVTWPGEVDLQKTNFSPANVRSLTGRRVLWGAVSAENGFFCWAPDFHSKNHSTANLRKIQEAYYYAKGFDKLY